MTSSSVLYLREEAPLKATGFKGPVPHSVLIHVSYYRPMTSAELHADRYTIPDDLLDEHCVHGLFVEDRVLFHHLLNTEGPRDLFDDAGHDLLHSLRDGKRGIRKHTTCLTGQRSAQGFRA